MYNFFHSLFGMTLSAEELTLMHLTVRAFLVYCSGLLLIRIQAEFMGINTPFNYIFNFIMGSLLADAIVGAGPFFDILGMCLFIAILNWLVAFLCYYSASAEAVFKGKPDVLVKDGTIIWKNMRKNLITKDELMEAIHRYTLSDDISRVKKAYFESSGQIIVITH